MPLPNVQITPELLQAAFVSVSSAITGITVGGVALAAGGAALVDYSVWAAQNPEQAAEFEANLSENFVSQSIGSDNPTAAGCAVNINSLPDSVKQSIVDYVAQKYRYSELTPVISADFPDVFVGGPIPTSINGNVVQIPSHATPYLSNCEGYLSKVAMSGGAYKLQGAFLVNGPVICSFLRQSSNQYHLRFTVPDGSSVQYVAFSSSSASEYQVHTSDFQDYLTFNDGFCYVYGVNCGDGYMVRDYTDMGAVPGGLSTAMSDFIAGSGTVIDVIRQGIDITGVTLPGVSVDSSTGVPTVADVDWAAVTYPDIVITTDGGGDVPAPVPTDVLTALQQIIGLLTPMGIVSGIPPIVQDIDTKMSAIVDEWPGVMDILDGLGLLPPIVQDIADGMGVIIDIPQSLEDITDILLPIPQSLQGLLDGVTIDIPQTLAQILNGTLSIPTAIDGVISGVAAIPAAIAGALDIDWVLDNTLELKDRLPDLDTPLILPQATFDDLKGIANDYKERTPLGKIFEAYEGTFEVMSTSPQGAPRYEITFPSPIDFSFVIDFAIFDGLFVQLAHAFFYLLAIFWYLKFIKRVKSWIDSWLTLGGGFAEVAEEESYAFRE